MNINKQDFLTLMQRRNGLFKYICSSLFQRKKKPLKKKLLSFKKTLEIFK